MGLASPDTDNWGHLGGMLGGLIATLPLQPSLLYVGKPTGTWRTRATPILVIAALVGVTLGVGPIIRALGPRYVTVEDHTSGLAFIHPAGWHFGENHLGYPAWGNSLGASIGLRAETRTSEPYSLPRLRQAFLQEELAGREEEGEITAVRVLGERPFLLPGGRAVELTVALESRAGPQITRNILVERGYYAYKVVLTAPAAWAAAYGPIFDTMAVGFRLTEPDQLEDARRTVATFPGMSSAHVELGNQLAAIGDVTAAGQAFQRALEALPDQPDATFGLAKLALDYGGDLETAERRVTALFERRPDDASVAALLADLRQRLGHTEEACQVLQEALDRAPDPPEDLRTRLTALSCRGVGWAE
ncbi:MAG: tetratricopeptide repeat protein [Myxococcales bacterium]|nr:tetratricopeptide repeat protein [Myxococcales bacterium]